jgi:hypothetical protein
LLYTNSLQGKLSRFKGAYPKQSDLLTCLINICTRALLEIETAVMIQERADDEVEKEKKERAEKLAQEQKGFTDAERVVEEKKQALHNAQKDGDDNEEKINEDMDEHDEGTQFPPEEQPVSPPSAFPLKFSSMTLNNYIRERPRSRLKFRQNKSLDISCSR